MDTDDRSKASDAAPSSSQTQLALRIEAQRAQLLQAHGVLVCLHDALLYAEDDHAVSYAEAAHVAADLVSDSMEELDRLHVKPLILTQ